MDADTLAALQSEANTFAGMIEQARDDGKNSVELERALDRAREAQLWLTVVEIDLQAVEPPVNLPPGKLPPPAP